MYQDPKTGIYISDVEILGEYRSKIIVVERFRVEDFIDFDSLMIDCIKMPQMLESLCQVKPSTKEIYRANTSYRPPQKLRQIPREIKYMIRRHR
jgi:hypothetical protein